MPDEFPESIEPMPGWSFVSLGHACSILSGGTPSKSEPKYWTGHIPWISGKDMKAPRLRDSIDHVSREAIGSGTRIAPSGSVLLLVRGMGLARDLPVAVALREMAFNQDVKALVPRDLRLGPFIRAAIYHGRDRLLSRVVPSAHGTMTLNLDDVENFQIAIPNRIEDAIAIGAVLDILQEKSERTTSEVAAVDSLRESTLHSLFTHGLSSSGPLDTNAGAAQQRWDVATIDEIATSTQYGLSVRGQARGKYPILRMNCQENGRVHYRNLQFVDLESATFETFRLRPGDLLFNRTNSIEHVGRMAIVQDERPAVFASYLVRLTIDPSRCLPEFLNYFMNWSKTQAEIKKLASRAVGQANINASKLRTIRVPLPTLDEQRNIVEILDTIDRKAQLQQQKRSTLAKLSITVLHKLMIGELRVGELNLSALSPPSEEFSA